MSKFKKIILFFLLVGSINTERGKKADAPVRQGGHPAKCLSRSAEDERQLEP